MCCKVGVGIGRVNTVVEVVGEGIANHPPHPLQGAPILGVAAARPIAALELALGVEPLTVDLLIGELEHPALDVPHHGIGLLDATLEDVGLVNSHDVL